MANNLLTISMITNEDLMGKFDNHFFRIYHGK